MKERRSGAKRRVSPLSRPLAFVLCGMTNDEGMMKSENDVEGSEAFWFSHYFVIPEPTVPFFYIFEFLCELSRLCDGRFIPAASIR
jgi:hypothetical protein